MGREASSGRSGPITQHEPHPHPMLTQAGSLHTLYLELLCQPGPPTSFEGCSDNAAGMDGSPMRLRRCLGGRFCILCPALSPVGEEEDYKARSSARGPWASRPRPPLCSQESSQDRTACRSPSPAPCQVDTAEGLLMLEWPEARAAAGRMQVQYRGHGGRGIKC